MLYQTPFLWQVLCIQNCWVHWDLLKKKKVICKSRIDGSSSCFSLLLFLDRVQDVPQGWAKESIFLNVSVGIVKHQNHWAVQQGQSYLPVWGLINLKFRFCSFSLCVAEHTFKSWVCAVIYNLISLLVWFLSANVNAVSWGMFYLAPVDPKLWLNSAKRSLCRL